MPRNNNNPPLATGPDMANLFDDSSQADAAWLDIARGFVTLKILDRRHADSEMAPEES